MQYVRNPNRYISYQNSYFDHLIKNSPNPYLFDLFDLRNFENFLLFANNNIIKEYHHILSYFNNYSFKIFINNQNDNILTDNTIINLNQNDYCKILLKDEYENYKDLFQDTYIMTINSQYFIIFYPENIANEIHFVNQFYLKHKYNIDLFYCRNIVYKKDQQDILFNNIKNALSLYNKNNIFLKNYMDLNFSIDQLEKHIIYFYQFKSQGLSYLS